MGSEALLYGHYDHTLDTARLVRNDSPGKWIVQKFGGTSLGKFADRVAEDIVRCGGSQPLIKPSYTLNMFLF